jgi:hypothetical protein
MPFRLKLTDILTHILKFFNVLIQKLVVAQLAKNLSSFMKPERSLLCSHQ